ncbi:hypothetical protein MSG28_009434 [Choristoneura fumiferana]|uniref:Uncharacterized protein n=1 Tax=Choristoneura fumiferana TaxID=7141 RepID=A0ACC0KXM7_CHOFU|nr:hypothetical protein MSG28_009434 [Choristoneura fumiferana]
MVIPGSPPESEAERWLEAGASATLGRVRYVAERACGARCYSGQAEAEAEAAAGAAAGAGRRAWRARPLREELPLLRRRRQLFEAELARAATLNVSLWLDTNEMVRIPVSGSVQLVWPRLVTAVEPAGDEALLAGVGAAAARWLRVRNPSPAHPLRVHALLAPALALPAPALTTAPQCVSEECVYSEGTFALAEWRAPHGGVAALPEAGPGEGEGEGGIALTLAPRAVVDFRVDFAPAQPALYHAHFYLRNNLTVVEGVELAGRGAVPSFELAGRRAGAAAPLLLQVDDCSEDSECGEAGEGGEGAGGGGRCGARSWRATRARSRCACAAGGWRARRAARAASGWSPARRSRSRPTSRARSRSPSARTARWRACPPRSPCAPAPAPRPPPSDCWPPCPRGCCPPARASCRARPGSPRCAPPAPCWCWPRSRSCSPPPRSTPSGCCDGRASPARPRAAPARAARPARAGPRARAAAARAPPQDAASPAARADPARARPARRAQSFRALAR